MLWCPGSREREFYLIMVASHSWTYSNLGVSPLLKRCTQLHRIHSLSKSPIKIIYISMQYPDYVPYMRSSSSMWRVEIDTWTYCKYIDTYLQRLYTWVTIILSKFYTNEQVPLAAQTNSQGVNIKTVKELQERLIPHHNAKVKCVELKSNQQTVWSTVIHDNLGYAMEN